MSRRKNETAEEYRARHAESERLRRLTPEWQEKNAAYRQQAEVKARHAEAERERRKAPGHKPYDREYRKKYRDENREQVRAYSRKHQKNRRAKLKELGLTDPYKPTPAQQKAYLLAWERNNPRRYMIQKSRHSAKPRGFEHTITEADLVWPTHCPILGLELVYDRDKKTPRRDCYPTLDRRDNALGYVPGNVFVISWRANRIKWMATAEELMAVANYAKHGLPIS